MLMDCAPQIAIGAFVREIGMFFLSHRAIAFPIFYSIMDSNVKRQFPQARKPRPTFNEIPLGKPIKKMVIICDHHDHHVFGPEKGYHIIP